MEKSNKLLSINIWKGIMLVSLPLIASNLLQILFNMVDIAVVGQFVGSNALGSVGSTAMIVSLFTGLLIGLGTGVNVIIARFIGSKDYDTLRKANSSSLIVCLFFGILLLILGVSLARPLLVLLKTKEELLDDAVLYLRTYFLGLPFLALYNYGSAVYAASGNTKRPLVFLVIAGTTNVCLNFFFTLVFNLGVLGVAIGSVIAQLISCVLILISIFKTKECFNLKLKDIKPYRSMVLLIVKIGIPAGLQNGIFAIANMFVQSGINTLPTEYVSGFSTTANIDSIIWETMYAFYTAAASFIAQNFASGNKKRILQSYFVSMCYAVTTAIILGGILYPFGKTILRIFTSDEIVVNAGYERLLIMGMCYFLAGFMDNAAACSRGLGKTIIPTIIIVIGSCIFRVAWVYIVFYHYNTLLSLCLVYPISWIITSICLNIYFFYIYKKLTKDLC